MLRRLVVSGPCTGTYLWALFTARTQVPVPHPQTTPFPDARTILGFGLLPLRGAFFIVDTSLLDTRLFQPCFARQKTSQI